jgi:virginiamycin A acetyltransferase
MKRFAKRIIDLICLLVVSPLIGFYFLSRIINRKDSSFSTCSQILSLLPGVTGSYLRKNFYRVVMQQCDSECLILFGTLFFQVETEIGRGVRIGPNCNIGMCKIEDDCILGSNVHIMSGSRQHDFNDIEQPIQKQGGYFEKIVIGADTWIGNGALIMANVGQKCVIGAGAVVSREVEDYAVVAGNPAAVIKMRKKSK